MSEHCDEAIFEELALGRLAPDAAERAMAHIRTCVECGRKYASAKDYVETIRKALRNIDDQKEN